MHSVTVTPLRRYKPCKSPLNYCTPTYCPVPVLLCPLIFDIANLWNIPTVMYHLRQPLRDFYIKIWNQYLYISCLLYLHGQSLSNLKEINVEGLLCFIPNDRSHLINNIDNSNILLSCWRLSVSIFNTILADLQTRFIHYFLYTYIKWRHPTENHF